MKDVKLSRMEKYFCLIHDDDGENGEKEEDGATITTTTW